MQFRAILELFGALAICSVAVATPLQPRSELYQGMPLHPMKFTGPFSPTGEDVTLEEVYAQIFAMNPDYQFSPPADIDPTLRERTIVSSTCSLPDGLQPAVIHVGTHYPIEDGIAYLKNLGGGVSPCNCDPHSCTRLSCSWGAAIYMCNDNDYVVSPQCHYLGDHMAQLINDNCASQGFCGGKDWDLDNYSITIQSEDC